MKNFNKMYNEYKTLYLKIKKENQKNKGKMIGGDIDIYELNY